MEINLLLKLGFIQKTNKGIYYISKIPLIGRLIKNDMYQNKSIKDVVGVIISIFSFIFSMVRLSIFFGAINLASFLLSMNTDIPVGIFVLFFTTLFALLGFQRSALFHQTDEKWYLLRVFKMDSIKYYKTSTVLAFLNKCKYVFLLFIASITYLDLGIFATVYLVLMPLSIFILSEGAYILYFEKHRKDWSLKLDAVMMGITLVVCPLLFIVIYYFKIPYFVFGILGLLLGALALYTLKYISEYEDFNAIYTFQLFERAVGNDQEQLLKQLTEETIKIDDDFSLENSLKLSENYSGYTLLNKVFNDRHTRVWQKPLIRNLKVILIVCVLVSLGLIAGQRFGAEFFTDLMAHFSQNFQGSLSVFLFILYSANITTNITKAYFNNCDVYLLNYSFYRRKEIVYRQYLSRLPQIVLSNLFQTLVIILFLIIWNFFFFKVPTVVFVSTIVAMISLTVLLSINELFMYYILQPFTEGLKISSTVYGFLKGAIYFLSFNSEDLMRIHNIEYYIIIFTVIFIVVSTASVRLFGDKTFKLKKD